MYNIKYKENTRKSLTDTAEVIIMNSGTLPTGTLTRIYMFKRKPSNVDKKKKN